MFMLIDSEGRPTGVSAPQPGDDGVWLPYSPLRSASYDPAHQSIIQLIVDGKVVEGLLGVPEAQYRVDRRAAYPSIADQLDAIWKGGDAAEAMRQQVAAVKERFPKA